MDIVFKVGKHIHIIEHLTHGRNRSSLETTYKQFIQPTLGYGDIIKSNMTDKKSQLIENVNKRAAYIIYLAIRATISNMLFGDIIWVSMETRWRHHRMYAFQQNCISFILSIPNRIPSYVRGMYSYQVRDADTLGIFPHRLGMLQQGRSRLCIWLFLWCLVPQINHLPPVCWSIFG